MAMGICVQCGQPVGNTKKACPHCGCAEPVPAKQILHCSTCNGIVEERHVGCPHCGAPDPMAPSSRKLKLGRCGKCGHSVSLESSACVRCKAPRQAEVDDVCGRCGGKKPVGHRMCAACADQPTPLPARTQSVFCPECHTELGHVGMRCLRCHPLASAVPGGRSGPAESDDHAPLFLAPGTSGEGPDAHVGTATCLVCAKQVPTDARPCPMCGTANPFDLKAYVAPAAKAPPRTFQSSSQAAVIAIVTLCVVGVAAALLLTRAADDGARRERVRLALGDRGSDAAVAAVEQEAQAIGVSTDALVKVRFVCLRHEKHRPATAELKAAGERAKKQGRNAEEAVVETARSSCQQ